MIQGNFSKSNLLRNNSTIISFIRNNLLKRNYSIPINEYNSRNNNKDLKWNKNNISSFLYNNRNEIRSNFKPYSTFIKTNKRLFSAFQTAENKLKENNNPDNFENSKEKSISPEQKEINNFMKSNEETLKKHISKISQNEEIKDHANYLKALEVCKFTANNDFTIKSRKTLLSLFRFEDYCVLSNQDFDEEKFIQYFSRLFYLELDKNDLAAIESKYFSIKDNLQIEDFIQLFDAMYYYEHYEHNFKDLKNDLLEVLNKAYFVLTAENVHNFNISLIFNNPNDIAKFSLFATEKLIQYTNFDYMPKILNLSQRLNYIQPLPKIISEIKNNPIVNDKMKGKILNSSSDILNKFFKNIPKSDVDEVLLLCLINSFFYGKLNTEVFELYVEGIYKNISSFQLDNLLEIFFFVLNISRNNKKISASREKLINQLLIIFSTTKQKPSVFLDTQKFYVYLNNCRYNLNEAFAGWSNKKQKAIKKMSQNEKDLLDRFKKIVRLSIDVYPFSTKDLDYSEELLDDLFDVFKNIVKKF